MVRKNGAIVPETGLTIQQTQAVKILLEGCSFRQCCERLGIAERTLWRWRKQAAFQRALHTGMLEAFNSSGGQGLSLLPEIIDTLKAIMRNSGASNSDRIAACKVLITSANEYQIRKQLESQVFELESRLMKLARFAGDSYSQSPEGDVASDASGVTVDVSTAPSFGEAAASGDDPFEGITAADPAAYIHDVDDPAPSSCPDDLDRDRPLTPGQQGIEQDDVNLTEATEWLRALTREA